MLKWTFTISTERISETTNPRGFAPSTLKRYNIMEKYTLVNETGCVMATVKATSIKEARSIFKESYSGDYKIICTEQVLYSVRL